MLNKPGYPPPQPSPAKGEGVFPLSLSAYDYLLPRDLIAQEPVERRDAARLLLLDRSTGATAHHLARDLPDLLSPGDVIIVNRSRVLPSRLIGRKAQTGGRVELTLLRPVDERVWEALIRGGRPRSGLRLEIPPDAVAELGERTADGWLVHFFGAEVVRALLARVGDVPLPPYIHEYGGDPERYQTVYGDTEGSAAAPTAGLHFTPQLIAQLKEQGIGWASVVLHIGLDTFRPMSEEDIWGRHIHTERVHVPTETVEAVAEAHRRGGRVVAVGTSTVRALEWAASAGELVRKEGAADLFILPGYRFRVVDALLTNFHMPRTTVLLLAAAFAGRERLLAAYDEAIRQRYRFLSFGDAMLIR